MQLIARRGDNGRRGARADRRPLHDGPLRRGDRGRVHQPGRRSSPATTTRSRRSRPTPQAFKSDVENAGLLAGRRARAGRDPHGQVTHAIVLIEAERAAIKTLGGELADVEGVAEAYSVTGEWDFVAMLRVRDPAAVAEVVTERFAGARRGSSARRRWWRSRSSPSTTSRRCSRSGLNPYGWSCQPRANQSGRSFQSCAISSRPRLASRAPVAPWWQRWPRIHSRGAGGRSGAACG